MMIVLGDGGPPMRIPDELSGWAACEAGDDRDVEAPYRDADAGAARPGGNPVRQQTVVRVTCGSYVMRM